MQNTQNKQKIIMLVETGLLLSLSAVLSLPFLTVHSPWLMGGSVTFGSMLPVILISFRWNTKWGMFSSFVLSLIQLVMGLNNVNYAPNAGYAIAIILLDYVIAFSVLGLGNMFQNKVKNTLTAIVGGITVSYFLRFVCHFFSGWLIWDALWPNEQGMSGWYYSLVYNGSYMLPETLLSILIAVLSYAALKKFWERQA
ncbi:MAG: energy-coupled thiamine transporter ThiT [Eubacteriales bacterium]|nr:energy-coupled thiamine transporter ThiT [Eubacteriales bacterium]